ncbi:MAG TPA: methyltransferase [Haliangiales bacterium]|nr:methyltransferase [Haliangiales bacterium]
MKETLRPTSPPLPQTPLDTEDQFYAFLAGGARHQLLLSAVDLGLDKLLSAGPLPLAEIIVQLGLDATRADKWMSLLVGVGLCELVLDPHGGIPSYAAAPLLLAMAAPDLAGGYFYREFLRYWRASIVHDTVGVVKGAPVLYPVRYPPTDVADTKLLHEWMRSGALLTLASLEKYFDFSWTKHLLDVGGGDATMACALTKKHPRLKVTVFNVPQAADLARSNIAAAGVGDRVKVVVGDFRVDALPRGFDTVLFSRVLADWPPDLCQKLINEAYASLTPDGVLVVCEPLRDQNFELSIAWEHSYLPYDDFGAHTYKTTELYEWMMAVSGFGELTRHPRRESIHGAIVARKLPQAGSGGR